MRFVPDTRAQPLAIARYFIAIAFAIMLYIIMEMAYERTISTARNQTTNQTALDALAYQEQLFNWLPLVFVLISGFGLLTLAVYQQRGI